MSRDRDPALPMNVRDLLDERQPSVRCLLDADGYEMVELLWNLGSDEHRRSPDALGEPARPFRIERLVVAGERQRIETLPLRFEDETKRRHRRVAPGGAVHVKVGRDHAVAAEHDGVARRNPIDGGADDRCTREQRRCQPPRHDVAHATTASRISTNK